MKTSLVIAGIICIIIMQFIVMYQIEYNSLKMKAIHDDYIERKAYMNSFHSKLTKYEDSGFDNLYRIHINKYDYGYLFVGKAHSR